MQAVRMLGVVSDPHVLTSRCWVVHRDWPINKALSLKFAQDSMWLATGLRCWVVLLDRISIAV